jgi:riboflavin kinase
MRLKGTVSSGLGRASIFMAQPHYQEQFFAILGEMAWPGTLNLKVDNSDLSKFIAMRKKAGIDTLGMSESLMDEAGDIDLSQVEVLRIRGFLREGKSFGGANAILCKIKSSNSELIPSAILIPDLTRHVDVIEIISAKYLRETMDVSNEDIINIEI